MLLDKAGGLVVDPPEYLVLLNGGYQLPLI
jgi:hypothetical protein